MARLFSTLSLSSKSNMVLKYTILIHFSISHLKYKVLDDSRIECFSLLCISPPLMDTARPPVIW